MQFFGSHIPIVDNSWSCANVDKQAKSLYSAAEMHEEGAFILI